MLILKQTPAFARWRRRLKDDRARALIASRLDRLSFGHDGDLKPVGGGILELRIHHGPGYRIYRRKHGQSWIVLLCGGSKSSQDRDIEAAKRLMQEIENGGYTDDL